MKISFTTRRRTKMTATVWLNDEIHQIPANTDIDLPVKRGDSLRWKVGRFSASHRLTFQSVHANFVIQESRSITVFLAVYSVMLLALAFFVPKQLTLLWIVVVAGLVAYEGLLYFAGFVALPDHQTA